MAVITPTFQWEGVNCTGKKSLEGLTLMSQTVHQRVLAPQQAAKTLLWIDLTNYRM